MGELYCSPSSMKTSEIFMFFVSTRHIVSGVLEFVADEGKVYIPYWMMQNLAIDQGGLLMVESASLPVATFAKFQPHSVDFLDLSNPKAVLESRLRNFACLSTGDVVAIDYNNKVQNLVIIPIKLFYIHPFYRHMK